MKDLESGIITSLIDKENVSSLSYQHLLINNRQHTMYNSITNLLNICDEYYFSVAFITTSGFQCLKKSMQEAASRGVRGKIITGNYQNFTQPLALSKMSVIDNLNIRLNYENNLHAKGFFFRIGSEWKVIVGSSNLTASALKSNNEWNLLLSSSENGKLVSDLLLTFDELYCSSEELDDVLDLYYEVYNEKRKRELNIKQVVSSSIESKMYEFRIRPNSMQEEALKSLHNFREEGKSKALIISATGSGKTYLSAFDVRAFKPKRCLFVAHRSTILKSAMNSFRRIISKKTMGEYNGNVKEVDCEYVFANISSLSIDDNLSTFSKDDFEYIIIDEVHRAGSESYLKVLRYFEPKFLLGMSATPERNDDFNIYREFDNNIAYEIRLKEAIDSKLVVPFHYYGVTDIYDSDTGNDVTFNESTIRRRVENLLEKSLYYGYDGVKVRGLVFVSSTSEAVKVAELINQTNYRAVSLVGSDSENLRQSVISRIALEKDDPNYIDYIVTVDIFNEGVDIPCINQVLLLRPTKSKIVYIQQIGRGLRFADNKNFLVIIDFIGNYENNFLIPGALAGDSSFDIDKLKNVVVGGTDFSPYNCTVEFEKVASELILENISKKLTKNSGGIKKIFRTDFKELEFRLGRMPLLQDFYNGEFLSPYHIVKLKSKNKSIGYHNILVDNFDYLLNLSKEASDYLKLLYQEFSVAKRIHEMVILNKLIEDDFTLQELCNTIENILGLGNQYENTKNAIMHLNDKVFTKDTTRYKLRKEMGDITLINVSDKISLKSDFRDCYNNEDNFRLLFDDLVNVNMEYAINEYFPTSENCFKHFAEYDRKECFHLIGDDYNGGTSIGGYRECVGTDNVLIFAKLDKSSYDNVLNSPNSFTWMSKKKRMLNSSILETKIANGEKKLFIFLRKSEGEKYYYIGDAEVLDAVDKLNGDDKIIEYKLKFKKEIPENLYKYLKY